MEETIFISFLNNFFSGWGLGGAQPLARAKARFHLAPTVYPYVDEFI